MLDEHISLGEMFMLVYSVRNRNTFDDIMPLVDKIRRRKDSQSVLLTNLFKFTYFIDSNGFGWQ